MIPMNKETLLKAIEDGKFVMILTQRLHDGIPSILKEFINIEDMPVLVELNHIPAESLNALYNEPIKGVRWWEY